MNSIKPDPDCLDVFLTDIQLHVQKARKPNSLGRQYTKAVRGSKASRAYSNDVKVDDKSKTVTFAIDLGTKYFADLLRKSGKKRIRIFPPKGGVPVFLGSDTVEKIKAVEKKVIAKRLDKGV